MASTPRERSVPESRDLSPIPDGQDVRVARAEEITSLLHAVRSRVADLAERLESLANHVCGSNPPHPEDGLRHPPTTEDEGWLDDVLAELQRIESLQERAHAELRRLHGGFE